MAKSAGSQGPSWDGAVGGPAGLQIREDLRAAHQAILDRWARPGLVWSGEQRIAIVAQVRRARAADPLPPWVAPSSVEGVLSGAETLPVTAIDAIWRLTNHPGTLTRAWYER